MVIPPDVSGDDVELARLRAGDLTASLSKDRVRPESQCGVAGGASDMVQRRQVEPREEGRIDPAPAVSRNVPGGVLRISDELGLHRLVSDPQQEFRLDGSIALFPDVRYLRSECVVRTDHSQRMPHPTRYDVSTALICGFDLQRNSMQSLALPYTEATDEFLGSPNRNEP